VWCSYRAAGYGSPAGRSGSSHADLVSTSLDGALDRRCFALNLPLITVVLRHAFTDGAQTVEHWWVPTVIALRSPNCLIGIRALYYMRGIPHTFFLLLSDYCCGDALVLGYTSATDRHAIADSFPTCVTLCYAGTSRCIRLVSCGRSRLFVVSAFGHRSAVRWTGTDVLRNAQLLHQFFPAFYPRTDFAGSGHLVSPPLPAFGQ